MNKRFKLLSFISIFVALTLAPIVNAGIPDNYQPIVVEPPFSFSKRVLDLTAAVAQSKTHNKPILLYLGAKDCPPCKAYERFLESNTSEMQTILSNYVVVDIRTWLKGPELYIRLGDEEKTLKQFRAESGDNRTGLWYPTWWLLNAELKQIKQIPSGSANFLRALL